MSRGLLYRGFITSESGGFDTTTHQAIVRAERRVDADTAPPLEEPLAIRADLLSASSSQGWGPDSGAAALQLAVDLLADHLEVPTDAHGPTSAAGRRAVALAGRVAELVLWQMPRGRSWRVTAAQLRELVDLLENPSAPPADVVRLCREIAARTADAGAPDRQPKRARWFSESERAEREAAGVRVTMAACACGAQWTAEDLAANPSAPDEHECLETGKLEQVGPSRHYRSLSPASSPMGCDCDERSHVTIRVLDPAPESQITVDGDRVGFGRALQWCAECGALTWATPEGPDLFALPPFAADTEPAPRAYGIHVGDPASNVRDMQAFLEHERKQQQRELHVAALDVDLALLETTSAAVSALRAAEEGYGADVAAAKDNGARSVPVPTDALVALRLKLETYEAASDAYLERALAAARGRRGSK